MQQILSLFYSDATITKMIYLDVLGNFVIVHKMKELGPHFGPPLEHCQLVNVIFHN
jgi:hypothetical protein